MLTGLPVGYLKAQISVSDEDGLKTALIGNEGEITLTTSLTLTDEIVINRSVKIVADGTKTITAASGKRIFNIIAEDDASVTLEKLTLVGDDLPVGEYGGAIYVAKNISLTIEGCHISKSKAPLGGAIYSKSDKEIKISNSVFMDNHVKANKDDIIPVSIEGYIDPADVSKSGACGGAIFASGDLSIDGASEFSANTIMINYPLISGNNITSNTFGGAIYTTGSVRITGTDANPVKFSNNELQGTLYAGRSFGVAIFAEKDINVTYATFDGNKANQIQKPEDQGGTSMGTIFGRHITIASSLFENNDLFYGIGGAVLALGNLSVSENSRFINNEASRGGAIAFYNGKLTISSSEFISNIAAQEGGAIAFVNPQIYNGTLPSPFLEIEIEETLFEKNTAVTREGGALYYTNSSTEEKDLKFLIKDCTFNENVGKGGGGVLAVISELHQAHTFDLRIEGETKFYKNTTGWSGGVFLLRSYRGNLALTIPETADVQFDQNEAGSDGGAIYIKDNSNNADNYAQLDISASFEKNNAGNGGAIYLNSLKIIDGKQVNTAKGTIRKKSVFTLNTATGNGGVINTVGASLTINGQNDLTAPMFEGNSAEGNGGAIYSIGNLTLDKGVFLSNEAQNGGAIYSHQYPTSEANLFKADGTYFLSNTSKHATGDADGGALFLNGKSSEITNAVFTGNNSKNNGGAIRTTGKDNSVTIINSLFDKNESEYGGAIANKEVTTVVTNATIVNNKAESGGGVIHQENEGSLSVQNSILWGNIATDNNHEYFPGNITFHYSLVKDHLHNSDSYTEANFNLDGTQHNPKFNTDTTDPLVTHYPLGSGSSAIDAGNNTYVTGIDTDLSGEDRIYNKAKDGIVDMGAYESLFSSMTAGFVGNGSPVCEGTSGSLEIVLTGTAPWKITYKREGSSNEIPRTIQAADTDGNGIYKLTGLAPGKYILTGVEGGAVIDNQKEATISSVSNPTVSGISGSSEVEVGKSITLSNATSGGTWMISNSGIATITLGGELTGVAAGTVEVWYVVTGGAPTNCETIVVHTVTVKNSGGKDPDPVDPDPIDPDPVDPDPVDPDPEWPPVVPEPDPDPDPDPDAWIIVRPGTEACFSDESLNVSFRLQYTAKPLRYAVAFTEVSKAAGFEDVKTYNDLPQDGIVSIVIPKGIKPGTYSGYLLLVEKGSTEYKMYPFTVKIKDGVRITGQPQPITQQNTGERFTLSVKAEGDNLTYQWFYNGERLEGATSSTYETIYSADMEGLYSVEVYGDCGWIESDEVMVTGCFGILIKWDDVIYVQNTDGNYKSFQWYRNGEAITTNGTSIYYTDASGLQGIYYARAYRADGTYDQSCPVEYSTVTRASTVSVYPKAIERNHYIHVESDELGGSYIGGVVEIYNLSGGKVYSQRLLNPRIEVPVNQPTGIYILQVTAPDGRRKTEKIVVR